MLIKTYKPYIILFLIILWIIVTAHLATASPPDIIEPAAQLEELLGDPDVYVHTIEEKAFYALAQILATMTSMIGFKYILRAIFPR